MLATVQSSKCRLGEEMLSDEMVHQELLGEVKRRLQRRRFHQMHVSDFIVLSSCLRHRQGRNQGLEVRVLRSRIYIIYSVYSIYGIL